MHEYVLQRCLFLLLQDDKMTAKFGHQMPHAIYLITSSYIFVTFFIIRKDVPRQYHSMIFLVLACLPICVMVIIFQSVKLEVALKVSYFGNVKNNANTYFSRYNCLSIEENLHIL